MFRHSTESKPCQYNLWHANRVLSLANLVEDVATLPSLLLATYRYLAVATRANPNL